MKMHDMQESTAVAQVGYSGRTRELHVRFRKGEATYVYVDVPFYVVGAIFRSKSRGRALHRHVIGKSQFVRREDKI